MQPVSRRVTVKRNARRAVYDPQVIRQVLDSQQVCHVAYVEDGEPRQIATLFMCDEDHIYLHGNRQSALLRHMARGGEVSISVMCVDGIVVARSGFHCSMNYRSVTVFGRGEDVVGEAHEAALERFVAVLIPGHEKAVRTPTAQEWAATAVVRVPLAEMSAKIRAGDPIDDPNDMESDVWAGVIPLQTQSGTPVPSADLKPGLQVPAYVHRYQAGR